MPQPGLAHLHAAWGRVFPLRQVHPGNRIVELSPAAEPFNLGGTGGWLSLPTGCWSGCGVGTATAQS